MSKIEDFRNAPVGATATHKTLVSRAMKMDEGKRRWILPTGFYYDDEEMAYWGYTLDPPAPTTAREALDLAWELAHPVKDGQVIPEGVLLLDHPDHNYFSAYTTQVDFTITAQESLNLRTLEPLPDPEPDWLDAPAVLATCGCRGIELWQPHDEKDNMWVNVSGEHARWSTLRDVTPLYPKEEQNA